LDLATSEVHSQNLGFRISDAGFVQFQNLFRRCILSPIWGHYEKGGLRSSVPSRSAVDEKPGSQLTDEDILAIAAYVG
jgi:hypothetical protein